ASRRESSCDPASILCPASSRTKLGGSGGERGEDGTARRGVHSPRGRRGRRSRGRVRSGQRRPGGAGRAGGVRRDPGGGGWGHAVFRVLGRRGTILEANISQTIGSASTALATGTIFTIPALFLWGIAPPYLQVVVLCFLGGVLGLSAMIPLRRILIVDARKEL